MAQMSSRAEGITPSTKNVTENVKLPVELIAAGPVMS